MQKQPETSSRANQTSLTQDLVALARYGLHSRTGKLILGAGVIAGGLFLGWDWLVVAGLAPIVLGVLPCLAMCALGLCMKPGNKSCSSDASGADSSDTIASVAKPDDVNSGQVDREKQKG